MTPKTWVCTPNSAFSLPMKPDDANQLRDRFRNRRPDHEWMCAIEAHAWLLRFAWFRYGSTQLRARCRLLLARPNVILTAQRPKLREACQAA